MLALRSASDVQVVPLTDLYGKVRWNPFFVRIRIVERLPLDPSVAKGSLSVSQSEFRVSLPFFPLFFFAWRGWLPWDCLIFLLFSLSNCSRPLFLYEYGLWIDGLSIIRLQGD